MEFLKENVTEVLNWPSNSPDLNLIENLWGIIKRNVEIRIPKNIDELKNYMVEEWNKISNTILKHLVGSIKGWCEEVIEKNSERIGY